jgi:hypothetical protein
MTKATKSSTSKIQILAGSKVTIPTGTRINTEAGMIKANRDFSVTVQSARSTPAGNIKVTWRGHRSMKSAVIKTK